MSAIQAIRNALMVALPKVALDTAGSVESQIIDVVGTYADMEAKERENSVNVIRELLASQRVTSADYYRMKATEFQLGDTLSEDTVTRYPHYTVVDETKRIIKQAYIIGQFPSYAILVNKIGSDGHLAALTTEELASFSTYFSAFEPIGMNIQIGSSAVTQITDPSITIYIQKGSDGQSICDAINAAFLAYEFVPRTYNTVTLTEIEDIIQRAHSAVAAVGFGDLSAAEASRVVYPVQGAFPLQNGAFIWATTIVPTMLRTI